VFDELSTAVNIKSKPTRLAILSALKHIQVYLKSHKLSENGVALFASEDLEVIIPPQPITTFIYKCDKCFHTDTLYDLYVSHDQYGVVLVSGSDVYIYIVTAINNTLLYKYSVSLQSRQKKGGQSALRIARLAEEKRQLYVKQIVEQVNSYYIINNKVIIKKLHVAGPAEMKTLVSQHELIDYRLKPLISIHTVDTITDNTIYTINIDTTPTDEELCKDIITNLNLGNPKYIYGKEDIDKYLTYKNCNILYVHHITTETTQHFDNPIVLYSDKKYGQLIQQYGGVILVAYYAMLEEDKKEEEKKEEI
jgi:peptide subunit release factor 1 (eRF1)